MNGDLLDKIHIETRPEKIPNQCIDENVNIFRLRKYFTTDGNQLLKSLKLKEQPVSIIVVFAPVILKIVCLFQYHLPCVAEMYSTKEGMVLPKLSLK